MIEYKIQIPLCFIKALISLSWKIGGIIIISATPGWFSKTDDITIRMIDDALHDAHAQWCHSYEMSRTRGGRMCGVLACRVTMCYDVLCHLESESCAVSRASSVQCPVIV